MVSMTTLNHDYVVSEDAQFSFEYALATQTAYAHRWGYPFFLQAVTPPGDEQHDKRLDWGRLYLVQRLQATMPAICEWIFAVEGDAPALTCRPLMGKRLVNDPVNGLQ